MDLGALLEELGRRELTYLLAEGGAEVLRTFVHGNLADELLVFVCPSAGPGGEDLPKFDIAEVRRAMSLPEPAEQTIGPDRLQRYVLR